MRGKVRKKRKVKERRVKKNEAAVSYTGKGGSANEIHSVDKIAYTIKSSRGEGNISLA